MYALDPKASYPTWITEQLLYIWLMCRMPYITSKYYNYLGTVLFSLVHVYINTLMFCMWHIACMGFSSKVMQFSTSHNLISWINICTFTISIIHILYISYHSITLAFAAFTTSPSYSKTLWVEVLYVNRLTL